jgi:hypothetical protein
MIPVELNDFIHRITGANDDLKSYKGSVSQSKHEKNKKVY